MDYNENNFVADATNYVSSIKSAYDQANRMNIGLEQVYGIIGSLSSLKPMWRSAIWREHHFKKEKVKSLINGYVSISSAYKDGVIDRTSFVSNTLEENKGLKSLLDEISAILEYRKIYSKSKKLRDATEIFDPLSVTAAAFKASKTLTSLGELETMLKDIKQQISEADQTRVEPTPKVQRGNSPELSRQRQQENYKPESQPEYVSDLETNIKKYNSIVKNIPDLPEGKDYRIVRAPIMVFGTKWRDHDLHLSRFNFVRTRFGIIIENAMLIGMDNSTTSDQRKQRLKPIAQAISNAVGDCTVVPKGFYIPKRPQMIFYWVLRNRQVSILQPFTYSDIGFPVLADSPNPDDEMLMESRKKYEEMFSKVAAPLDEEIKKFNEEYKIIVKDLAILKDHMLQAISEKADLEKKGSKDHATMAAIATQDIKLASLGVRLDTLANNGKMLLQHTKALRAKKEEMAKKIRDEMRKEKA